MRSYELAVIIEKQGHKSINIKQSNDKQWKKEKDKRGIRGGMET
jgi:hypothetical protein